MKTSTLFLKRLLILIISFGVFLGIPIFFDNTFLLLLSWLPALFVAMYLDDN